MLYVISDSQLQLVKAKEANEKESVLAEYLPFRYVRSSAQRPFGKAGDIVKIKKELKGKIVFNKDVKFDEPKGK